MSFFGIASLAIGGLLFLVGLRSIAGSFGLMSQETGGDRALVAVHEVAKAGFWFALGAFFLGSALLDDAEGLRWFLLVPISLAGIRLVAATFLSR